MRKRRLSTLSRANAWPSAPHSNLIDCGNSRGARVPAREATSAPSPNCSMIAERRNPAGGDRPRRGFSWAALFSSSRCWQLNHIFIACLCDGSYCLRLLLGRRVLQRCRQTSRLAGFVTSRREHWSAANVCFFAGKEVTETMKTPR